MIGKRRITVKMLTRTAIIAACYAALTLALYPLSYGAFQFRFSEALTVLPFIMPEAIPGLFIGCILSNIMSPNIVLLDVAFGSLATLLAAWLTSRVKSKWLAPLPPVIVNAAVVGAVITFSSVVPDGQSFAGLLIYNIASVGVGELAVCYTLGIALLFIAEKTGIFSKNTSTWR